VFLISEFVPRISSFSVLKKMFIARNAPGLSVIEISFSRDHLKDSEERMRESLSLS
jgi:hypothetical protein